MKRRNFLSTTVQACAGSYLLSHLYACKTNKLSPLSVSSEAPYKMQILRGDVGYFTEKGGTIGWLVDSKGIAVVDSQFPDQAQHLVTEVNKMKADKIDILINTHHHGDHTGGNKVIGALTDRVLAHTNSKTNQVKTAIDRGNEADQLYPSETFDDNMVVKVGKESIRLSYFGAGHTNGDAIVHFENANVAHLGDLVFNRRFPYIDTSAGANIDNWIKVLDKTIDVCDRETIFMFGHAEEGYDIFGGIETIRAFQNYLSRLLAFGEKSLKSGIPLEELIANTSVIPGAEEWKGKGIDRSLKAVYAELARE